jgi:plastocyanin
VTAPVPVAEEVEAAAPAAATVTIANFAFDPPALEVAAGTTVTWVNQDPAPHTATAADGAFDTGQLDEGQTASQTFDEAGTFAYRCNFHPEMLGTVVVA